MKLGRRVCVTSNQSHTLGQARLENDSDGLSPCYVTTFKHFWTYLFKNALLRALFLPLAHFYTSTEAGNEDHVSNQLELLRMGKRSGNSLHILYIIMLGRCKTNCIFVTYNIGHHVTFTHSSSYFPQVGNRKCSRTHSDLQYSHFL